MTEERLEQLVEGAAGRFDRSMNRAWEHRPVRLMGGALSLLTGAGLIAKAVPWLRRAVPRRPGYAWAAGSLSSWRRPPASCSSAGNEHPFSRGKSASLPYLAGWRFSVTGERRCLPRQAGPQAAVPAGSGGC